MKPTLAIALLAVAACGDNLSVRPDAAAARDTAPDGAAAACTAHFSGNFSELATTAATCATLGSDGSSDTLLELAIPSATLGSDVAIAIDLGVAPAGSGAYSSESVAAWSARAVQVVGIGACVYNAGATAIPPGNFALTLASLAHGSLSLTMWVLAYPGTDCGTGDTEQLDVEF